MDVPVFIVPGNHDGYARYNLWNTQLEEDYMASWRDLFGPQYFSFDYGSDYHFTALNSMDWSAGDRNLHWLIPNVMLRPRQVAGPAAGGRRRLQGRLVAGARGRRRPEQAHRPAGLGPRRPRRPCRRQDAHHRRPRRPLEAQGSGAACLRQRGACSASGWAGQGAGRLAADQAGPGERRGADDQRPLAIPTPTAPSPGKGEGVRSSSSTPLPPCSRTPPDLLDPKWDKMWVFPGFRTIHIDDGAVVNFYYMLANDQGRHSPAVFLALLPGHQRGRRDRLRQPHAGGGAQRLDARARHRRERNLHRHQHLERVRGDPGRGVERGPARGGDGVPHALPERRLLLHGDRRGLRGHLRPRQPARPPRLPGDHRRGPRAQRQHPHGAGGLGEQERDPGHPGPHLRQLPRSTGERPRPASPTWS